MRDTWGLLIYLLLVIVMGWHQARTSGSQDDPTGSGG
jgi:hypothetical protein